MPLILRFYEEPITAGIILDKLKFDKNYPVSAVLYWGESLSPFLVNFGTMTRKLQLISLFVLFLLLALANLAMAPSVQVFSSTPTVQNLKPDVTPSQPMREITATPVKTRSAPASLAMQAGDSDSIALIGILLVVIIIIPIGLKYKEWWGR